MNRLMLHLRVGGNLQIEAYRIKIETYAIGRRKSSVEPGASLISNNSTADSLTLIRDFVANISHVAEDLTNNLIAPAAAFQVDDEKGLFIFALRKNVDRTCISRILLGDRFTVFVRKQVVIRA